MPHDDHDTPSRADWSVGSTTIYWESPPGAQKERTAEYDAVAHELRKHPGATARVHAGYSAPNNRESSTPWRTAMERRGMFAQVRIRRDGDGRRVIDTYATYKG